MDIIVLVSGGVDSSVALRLLQEEGHCVTACYLKIWLEDELSYLGSCPWEEDLTYVRALCEQAHVPLEVISLQQEYHERVVADMITRIREGVTPNPDMLCNATVKFGAFLERIPGSLQIATGHYAQLVRRNGELQLLRAPDPIKDQSYFLALLTPAQLQRSHFPIGHLTKEEVRARAAAYNLPTKDRKDSQGICFLGKLSFTDFIIHHLGRRPGKLIEYETGKIQGSHQGYWFFTPGQRSGIGLSGGPWYVVTKDVEENIVYISRAYYNLTGNLHLLRTQCLVPQVNWLCPPLTEPRTLQLKLRHGPQLHTAKVIPRGSGLHITLDEPDQGIAPGQYAVLYEGLRCLGGGIMVQQERL